MQQGNETRNAVDFDELYPGRFIKAGSLKGKQVTLEIETVHVEKLEGDTGAKWKGVVTFKKTEMQLVLNKTNGTCLREMFGREIPKWVGRKVTLFPSEWNGEPCIRIWGSPELERDKTIQVALPRRKPITMVMHAVRPAAVKGGKAQPAAAAGAPPETSHDAETGEVTGDPEPQDGDVF
jgi:hypothetical protein